MREIISVAIDDFSLGRILVARSEAGICAVLIGDDDHALMTDLRVRFPRADFLQSRMDGDVLLSIEQGRTPSGYVLDLRGTAFQKAVWARLCEIPHGATASYREIADRMGVPSAVRAVAGACGANAHAILIPCHRVVRSDGGLSGYRWGIEHKRLLLERESGGLFAAA